MAVTKYLWNRCIRLGKKWAFWNCRSICSDFKIANAVVHFDEASPLYARCRCSGGKSDLSVVCQPKCQSGPYFTPRKSYFHPLIVFQSFSSSFATLDSQPSGHGFSFFPFTSCWKIALLYSGWRLPAFYPAKLGLDLRGEYGPLLTLLLTNYA